MAQRNWILSTLAILLLFAVESRVYGQDPVFGQHFAAPSKTNPAFTGLTYLPMIHANYRNQWPGFNKAYVTYFLSYSQFAERLHSGFGAYVQADNAGDGLFVTTEAKALYAYQLEPRKNIFLRLGTEVGVLSQNIGVSKLIFPEDVEPETPAGHQSEVIDPDAKTSIDIGAGLLLYNRRFYLGYSLAHINRPDLRFLEVSSNLYGGYPIRHSVQLGAQIDLGVHSGKVKKNYLAPRLGWFKQADFTRLDLDVLYGFGKIFAGLGFRNAHNNDDALKITAGLSEGILKIGYSYEYTVSKLTNRSFGSHEVSLSLNFDQSEKAKRARKYAQYRDCFAIFR